MHGIVHPRAHRRNQATWAALAETLAHHLEGEHPPHTLQAGKPAQRDAHLKQHGCVQAIVRVPDDLPEDLRRGVFKPGASYPAWIRFSNAFKDRHDLDLDARGMAIKLLDVEGDRVRLLDIDGQAPALMDEGEPTQDFLLVTHSEFFGATAAEFLGITSAIIKSKSAVAIGLGVGRCFFGLKPPRFRWRGAKALLCTMKWTSNPLFLDYFSQTPYRYWSKDRGHPTARDIVKFCVRPLQRGSWKERVKLWRALVAYWAVLGRTAKRKNMLSDALHEYLAGRDARFELCVQLRTHPECMRVDDATRPWPTKRSPYRRVAIIRIPRDQRYRDPQFVEEGRQRGERLTFSPWHALEDHRPLGSLNRARLFVYARISTLRNGLNHAPATVPRPGGGGTAPVGFHADIEAEKSGV